jgi:hypothetical protein
MPFQDDTGLDTTVDRGPLWGAFAAFGGQLERMILLNIAWALQALPAVLAVLLPALPDVLRAALLIYSALALLPATGALYAMARAVSADQHLSPALLADYLRGHSARDSRRLLALFGGFGLVLLAAGWAGETGIFALSVLLQLAILLAMVVMQYWGALVAARPGASAIDILAESAWLAWRYPLRTLLLCGAVAVTLLIGLISVGGMVLAVPLLIALLQTQMLMRMNADVPTNA